MTSKILYYLNDFSTSRLGWILVIANLLLFAYLFEEIALLQEMSRGFCDESGIKQIGFTQSSNLFNLFVLLNIFPTIIGQYLSDIIFWNFKDVCVNYSYEKYPFIYVGKFVILLLCQSIQWLLIGYGFEKLCRLMIKTKDSKHR